MLSSKYALCDNRKLKFIKKQEAGELLNMIGKILVIDPSLI